MQTTSKCRGGVVPEETMETTYKIPGPDGLDLHILCSIQRSFIVHDDLSLGMEVPSIKSILT